MTSGFSGTPFALMLFWRSSSTLHKILGDSFRLSQINFVVFWLALFEHKPKEGDMSKAISRSTSVTLISLYLIICSSLVASIAMMNR